MSSSNTSRRLAETGQIAWGGAGVGSAGTHGGLGSTTPTGLVATPRARAPQRGLRWAALRTGPSPALPTRQWHDLVAVCSLATCTCRSTLSHALTCPAVRNQNTIAGGRESVSDSLPRKIWRFSEPWTGNGLPKRLVPRVRAGRLCRRGCDVSDWHGTDKILSPQESQGTPGELRW